jgi:HD-like signal output (HDOD) protein
VTGGQLPALQQSAVQLLHLSQDPESGPAELAIPIESDPGLKAQVLRFVNSSYFGFARKISTIRLALTLVGTGAIRNFVLWCAVFNSIPNPKCGPFDLTAAWQDSLRRALFARWVAKHLGIREAEEPFAAALLQDMALPVLAKAVPQVYARLFEIRSGGAARLSEMERRLFGWTHAEAGAMMCREWNLPDRLASLIEAHAAVERYACGEADDPAQAAVALSALLPSGLDPVWTERDLFDRLFRQTMSADEPIIADLLGEVDRLYAELAPMLRLPPARQPLAEFCQGVAAGCGGG